jgi:polar amino acid transport system ATP-binding protein
MQEGIIIEQGSPAELLAEGSGTRTLDFCSQILDVEGCAP